MQDTSSFGYDERVQDKLYEKTIKRAFNILSAKPRSIVEMRTRLLEKEWATAEIVERAISRLCELGYLDDEKFAVQFANSISLLNRWERPAYAVICNEKNFLQPSSHRHWKMFIQKSPKMN